MDKQLLRALTEAYIARAHLFHNGVRAARIDLLFAEIDAIEAAELEWDAKKLGITQSALQSVRESGADAHQVFAHPSVIVERPHLIAYYRNLVAISRKGISQILFGTESYEAGKRKEITEEKAEAVCVTLNRIIAGVIDKTRGYKVELSRQTVLAEIGTELQGTWANIIGTGAARRVEEILDEYISSKKLGEKIGPGKFRLENGWRIVFGSEPDVAFYDAKGTKQIAIEIKGSLDKAGAQTRYGEAKKSFGKQIAENPRCHTVYVASCFTDAVISQIKADGQVRAWENLTSILYDEDEKARFLERLFHRVRAPK